MKDVPLVSIIVNNFNYGRYLPGALDSALSQSYPQVEVIVVDDGSTDSSREQISCYEGRVTAIFKENGGQASAFNAGFEHSRGQIVCFLDSDDLLAESKVSRVVEAFRTSPEIGWCFHPLVQLDRETRRAIPGRYRRVRDGFYDQRARIGRGEFGFRAPATSGLAFRRSLLSRILPMPEYIKIASDNYIKFAALAMSVGAVVDEGLAMQGVHNGNLYTYRGSRDPVRTLVHMKTAKALSENFPKLIPLADRLLAQQVGNSVFGVRLPGGVRRELFEQYKGLEMRRRLSVTRMAIGQFQRSVRAKLYSPYSLVTQEGTEETS